MKGYKVTDAKRSRTVGLACKTLAELLKKGKEKLKMEEAVLVALEDGTLVQDADYFSTLPAQTVFVFYKYNEHIVTGVDVILNALKNVNSTYLNVSAEVANVMKSKASELSSILSSVGSTNGTGTGSDASWFDGLETNAKTKEEFMFRKAQDRIRGYLYKFQDDIRKSNEYKEETKRTQLQKILDEWKSQLAVDKYFGCYFDRRFAGAQDFVDSGPRTKKKMKILAAADLAKTDRSFCDADGLFSCEGLWKDMQCSYRFEHSINPYISREARVLFSTWNLDHRIEKSRTILPTLLSAVNSPLPEQKINVQYFYRMLFTRDNLKCVHIVCHDKKAHDIVCDNGRLFLPI